MILRKLALQRTRLAAYFERSGRHRVFYSRKIGYFTQVLDFEPLVLDGRGRQRPPSEFKSLTFGDSFRAAVASSCLNANLFYWFLTVFSDCRHVNKREVNAFPVNLDSAPKEDALSDLPRLAGELMAKLKETSEYKRLRFQHDELEIQCIFPKRAKHLIDDIDRALAGHFGFTSEETDFLINYDVKYRMGQEGEE